MNPLRYEVSDTRRRLSGTRQQRGSQTGFSSVGACLLGLVFAAAGTYIILVGTKMLPVNPATVHAPYWIVTAMGTVFVAPAIWIWTLAWRQHTANRRNQEAARHHPNEPALADYPWNPRGYQPQRWRKATGRVTVALLLTLFLSAFNYFAFEPQSPWPLKAFIALFDLIAVVIWCVAALAVGRAIKFGGSQIAFTSFPYRLGKPIVIRWEPASGIGKANKGSFTLRCIEEWYETTGTGKDRSRQIVHEEIWSGTWRLDQPRDFQSGQKVDFSFAAPADLHSTTLSADRPILWEFEVKLDLPGLDFDETYLVPIYGRVGEKIEA
ncbi:MAG: hypothetical protein JWM16_2402 [Verrucomicrobiales bacterium]|nr:hypothetical protein [Verrucomicrobiales bacterium]